MWSSLQFIFGLVTFLVVGAYLGSLGYLFRYLRLSHTTAWVDLGEPTFSLSRLQDNPFKVLWGLTSGLLYVFSNNYKAAQDRRLAILVWQVRALFALSGLFVIIQFAQ